MLVQARGDHGTCAPADLQFLDGAPQKAPSVGDADSSEKAFLVRSNALVKARFVMTENPLDW